VYKKAAMGCRQRVGLAVCAVVAVAAAAFVLVLRFAPHSAVLVTGAGILVVIAIASLCAGLFVLCTDKESRREDADDADDARAAREIAQIEREHYSRFIAPIARPRPIPGWAETAPDHAETAPG
jgi:hypothetical protein